MKQEPSESEYQKYLRTEIQRGIDQLDRGERAIFDAEQIIAECRRHPRSGISMRDAALVDQFAAALSVVGELLTFDPVPPEMDDGAPHGVNGPRRWRPIAVQTERSAIDALYRNLPQRFPPLYEHLILSYRWLELTLDPFLILCANPPGMELDGLLCNITRDPAWASVLFPLGLIPIGQAIDSYDPICFDTSHPGPDGDCPIIRVEHEAVLCDRQLGDSWEFAASCRSLMERVIAAAK